MKQGDRISGKYRLLRRLGEGGMGEVWAARNERTDRDFAIKFLLPYLVGNSQAIERFVREARATGQLHHPNVVSVLDAGRAQDGRPYLVMELLAGESLEQRLARERVLPHLSACVLFSQVARALEAAHRAGLVHRDLSSGNVFLVPADQGCEPVARLLDFGVSKILGSRTDGCLRTGNGAMLGAVEYMSPEQACGAESVDERTDLWSFGVLLYECLSGQHPFGGNNYRALIFNILQTPHRPLSQAAPRVDPELCSLVEACLVKDREARLGSARQLAEQLERIAWRLSASGAERASIARRRATDRLSTGPRELRSGRPSLATTGMPSRVLPVGVRWWHWFEGQSSARQLIALSSAIAGAVVGGVLGHLMADASAGEPVSLPFADAPVAAVSMREYNPAVRSPFGEHPKVPMPSSRLARGEQQPISLVQSVARGLGLGQDPVRQALPIAASRAKVARE
ncbi:MAG: serine/threonine protein kinase [Polyangiaceae bacterium]|nr:serine/threonine protein kinase [Polyangiaceae bacterium]